MDINWRRVGIIFFLTLVLIIAFLSVGVFFGTIPRIPEIVLPVLLVGGIALLLVTLMIVVMVLAQLNLTDSAHAFGMPEGTIRAIIALSLILIFSITSLYLHERLRDPNTTVVKGLTHEQFDAIPGQSIISSQANLEDPTRIDVLRQTDSEASKDFAQQTLTTISTLVVAVAGFYFGTTAVGVAKNSMLQPGLRIIKPESPATVSADGSLLIRLDIAPAGMAVTARADTGTLTQTAQYDEFEYNATGVSAGTSAILTFTLVANPSISQVLTVNVI
ncbi:MAG: hypothetical protein K8L99_08110 [Anaerolineae bacterium]|nr:hypothetical protein [Anaerolineae bacterium]